MCHIAHLYLHYTRQADPQIYNLYINTGYPDLFQTFSKVTWPDAKCKRSNAQVKISSIRVTQYSLDKNPHDRQGNKTTPEFILRWNNRLERLDNWNHTWELKRCMSDASALLERKRNRKKYWYQTSEHGVTRMAVDLGKVLPYTGCVYVVSNKIIHVQDIKQSMRFKNLKLIQLLNSYQFVHPR